jgi:AAA domain
MLARGERTLEAFRKAGVDIDDEPTAALTDEIPPVTSLDAFGDFPDGADLEHALEREQETATAEESDCLEEWDAGEDTESPPPREWLLGNQFCRKFVSGLTAPGATGKSATRLVQYMALAIGRDIVGQHVFKRTRVLVISMEDDRDELRRRIRAACLHHDIEPGELRGWFYCWTPKGIKLATMKDGAMQKGHLETLIRAKIKSRGFGLVALDPFIKVHALGENDNGAMDYVCELLTKIAIDLNVAVDIPQHTKKGQQTAGDADAGRGASSTRDAGRLFYTLTRMTEDEAKQFGIAAEQRALYVRLDSSKVNIAPPSDKATWFKLVGVQLGNATADYPAGDEVQTVERWHPPETWEGVSAAQLNAALTDIDAGLANGQRFSGAGAAKGERAAWLMIQRHATDRTEPQCREIIRTWIKNGVLLEDEYDDPIDRKPRKGLTVCNAKRPT